VVKILTLSPELHRDPRPCGHVRSCGGRLLAGYSAADGVQLQANVLRAFHGPAHRFADE
jgi:hypothetical protein